MKGSKVVFIAYKDHENLGVGYISSKLLSRGFDVDIVDFGLSRDKILSQVKRADPLIVGFSLIFQYHTFELRDLARYLKENGVSCHFTVGGHYPSLRFEDLLNIAPDIDSVVRFEGELTLCELAESLSKGEQWKKIKGVAYRSHGNPISNELRPLIGDLDTLPFPLRREKKFMCMGENCSFLIASRGCVRNCSFCSIRRFYLTPPGKLRRSRAPSKIVEEMKELYEKRETRIFLFQDDNFFLPGKLGKEWVQNFIDELENEGLAHKIFWKISCRSDEVEFTLFRKLKQRGLSLVYLGIESGNQVGLEFLNKQLSVEDNIRAVDILNRLEILYDFGFMLFDPSSTFESVKMNIDFLRKICGDGSSPVVFCKTVPYAETDVEKKLISEGRLKGSIINPDYDFLDRRLDRYYEFLHRTFREWMFARSGMLSRLRWHRFEVAVLKKFYPHAKGIPEYDDFLRDVVASSNELFFQIAEKAATFFQDSGFGSEKQLDELGKFQHIELKKINSRLREGMIEFHSMQR